MILGTSIAFRLVPLARAKMCHPVLHLGRSWGSRRQIDVGKIGGKGECESEDGGGGRVNLTVAIPGIIITDKSY